MKPEFWSIFFKMLSIGTIAASACLWADAGVDNRPKRQDEQTLIGGMIWSQLIILMGLLVSMILGERINVYMHGYFLMAGVLLCFISSAVLVSNFKDAHWTSFQIIKQCFNNSSS